MADIKKELYLSLFLNRSKRCYTIIASAEGGVEIESVKSQIIKEIGLGDVSDEIANEVAKEMGLEGITAQGVVDTLKKLSKLTIEKEAELVEINPLAIMQDDTVMALDGKFVTDDNANFRHDELQKYQEKTEIEEQAEKSGFSLVELDGDIAVVGNGAGLVMSTLDMLSDNGGKPACFLDVGGGASAETVSRAFKILLSDKNVRVVLVNIFGGIMRCDVIAEGIVSAVKDVGIQIPIVVRLEGTNVEIGKKILDESKLNITSADSLGDAAKQAVIFSKA